MKTFTLEELKVRIAKIDTDTNQRRVIPDALKKDIVEYHYQTGKGTRRIQDELDIDNSALIRWKKLYGQQRTAFIHGNTVRNDIRTKCLAVQRHMENEEKVSDLAIEFGVATQTMYGWISRYKERYKEYLDLPDGVATIVKEERQVFGNKNIAEIETVLKENYKRLQEVLKSQHFGKTDLSALKKVQEHISKDIKKVNTLKGIAKDLGVKFK